MLTLLIKESVLSFEEKTQPWLPYFQIAGKYQKSFETNQLNIIFDDLGIHVLLLGYRTKFSCLYLPQGHEVLCGYQVQMNM